MRLKNIALRIGSGLTPSRTNPNYWGSPDIPWLKTEQLGEYLISETNEFISNKALEETSISLWPENTISVAMYGEGQTRGKVSILAKPMTTNQACCNIVVDSSVADYRFVYYWLSSQYTQIRSLAAGVRKNLNSNDIRSYPFPDVDKSSQVRAADVLAALDDKIANNKKLMAELEATARLIYDYWFTQFDFPDENGRPYRSSGGAMVYNETLHREIPIDWEVVTFSDLVEVRTGREDASFATERGRFKFFTCGQEILRCDRAAFEGEALLVAGNGDFGIKHYSGEFNAYQRTYVLIPDESLNRCVMYFALKDNISSFVSGSSGSIVKFITKSMLEDIVVLVPNNKKLTGELNQYLVSIEYLQKENGELEELRDWLLPMLMNGQLVVE